MLTRFFHPKFHVFFHGLARPFQASKHSGALADESEIAVHSVLDFLRSFSTFPKYGNAVRPP